MPPPIGTQGDGPRRKRLGWLALLLALAVGMGGYALRPVCVPLSDEDRAAMNVPIEQRGDRDFYLRVFQFREGRWHQCKTWLSRRLFF